MKKSTYDLIVQSEDKKRTVMESVICALLIGSAVFSILQVATQPVTMPRHVAANSISVEYRA